MSLILPLDHQHFPFIWRVCQQQFDRWRVRVAARQETRMPDLPPKSTGMEASGEGNGRVVQRVPVDSRLASRATTTA
jgi:hypothetical protein